MQSRPDGDVSYGNSNSYSSSSSQESSHNTSWSSSSSSSYGDNKKGGYGDKKWNMDDDREMGAYNNDKDDTEDDNQSQSMGDHGSDHARSGSAYGNMDDNGSRSPSWGQEPFNAMLPPPQQGSMPFNADMPPYPSSRAFPSSPYGSDNADMWHSMKHHQHHRHQSSQNAWQRSGGYARHGHRCRRRRHSKKLPMIPEGAMPNQSSIPSSAYPQSPNPMGVESASNTAYPTSPSPAGVQPMSQSAYPQTSNPVSVQSTAKTAYPAGPSPSGVQDQMSDLQPAYGSSSHPKAAGAGSKDPWLAAPGADSSYFQSNDNAY